MYLFFYNIFRLLYNFSLWLFSKWNDKAALLRAGRKDLFSRIESAMAGTTGPRIWMHCASLGEFEQGRPLIEELRRLYPGSCIVLTFFSPSGYEIKKNYDKADHIFYLPADSRKNAKRFVALVNPQLVLWVKYDYWYYYLSALANQNIPTLLVSGNFRKDQVFFRWYGKLHRSMIRCFSVLFVQNEDSRNCLAEIGLHENVFISGDTRFDRVLHIAGRFEPIPVVEEFCNGFPVIVAGSTWQEDIEELDHYANRHPEIRFIVAPHEIREEDLQETEKLFKKSIRYSRLLESAEASANPESVTSTTAVEQHPGPNVLIIDNIGMLSRLYHYASIAYVGGGFCDTGVHNILEAAVYRRPVIFGPAFDWYNEAVELIDLGGAFSIDSALELEKQLDELLSNRESYEASCAAAGDYVQSKKGATERIIRYIQENRLLTNL